MTQSDPDQEFQVSKKLLEVLRTYKTIKVEPELFWSSEFEIDFNKIRVMLEKNMVSDNVANDTYTGYTEYSRPATTWQMFKATNQGKWWLRWLVRRKPVKTLTFTEAVEIEVKRYLAYPQAVINSARLGKPIIFEQVDQIRGF